MDSFSTRLYAFSGRSRLKSLLTTLFVFLVLMELCFALPASQHESFRLQIDKYVSRRSRSPLSAPGAIVGLVLGCLFALLVVLVTILFTRRKRRKTRNYAPHLLPTSSRMSTLGSLPVELPGPELVEHFERYERYQEIYAPWSPPESWRWVGETAREVREVIEAAQTVHAGDSVYELGIAPSAIWMPTESELDLAAAQRNNPAFNLPLSLQIPIQFENEQLSGNEPTTTTKEDNTAENILPSDPNDPGPVDGKKYVELPSNFVAERLVGDNTPGSYDITNETFSRSPQGNDHQSLPEPDLPPSASSVSPSTNSQPSEKTPQKILPCPAPHCTRTFNAQFKLKSSPPSPSPTTSQLTKPPATTSATTKNPNNAPPAPRISAQPRI